MSVLVVAQSSLEIPEGLMNNPVFLYDMFQSFTQVEGTSTDRKSILLVTNFIEFSMFLLFFYLE